MKKFLLMLLIFAASAGLARAWQTDITAIELPNITVELKAGQGQDRTSALCNICHSLDYITMQPPFPRSQWTATVTKMIKVMGGPISDEDAKTIINYLVSQYGTGN